MHPAMKKEKEIDNISLEVGCKCCGGKTPAAKSKLYD